MTIARIDPEFAKHWVPTEKNIKNSVVAATAAPLELIQIIFQYLGIDAKRVAALSQRHRFQTLDTLCKTLRIRDNAALAYLQWPVLEMDLTSGSWSQYESAPVFRLKTLLPFPFSSAQSAEHIAFRLHDTQHGGCNHAIAELTRERGVNCYVLKKDKPPSKEYPYRPSGNPFVMPVTLEGDFAVDREDPEIATLRYISLWCANQESEEAALSWVSRRFFRKILWKDIAQLFSRFSLARLLEIFEYMSIRYDLSSDLVKGYFKTLPLHVIPGGIGRRTFFPKDPFPNLWFRDMVAPRLRFKCEGGEENIACLVEIERTSTLSTLSIIVFTPSGTYHKTVTSLYRGLVRKLDDHGRWRRKEEGEDSPFAPPKQSDDFVLWKNVRDRYRSKKSEKTYAFP